MVCDPESDTLSYRYTANTNYVREFCAEKAFDGAKGRLQIRPAAAPTNHILIPVFCLAKESLPCSEMACAVFRRLNGCSKDGAGFVFSAGFLHSV